MLSPTYRQQTPLQQQLEELLEKLDVSVSMKHSPSRSKRLKLLKKTIMEVRAELNQPTATPRLVLSEPTQTSPAGTNRPPAPMHKHGQLPVTIVL